MAAKWANADVVKLLLSASNIDVNAADGRGHTPLHKAITVHGTWKSRNNDNNNASDPSSFLRLCGETHLQSLDIVAMLIDTGKADVNQKDIHGETAIHKAVRACSEDVVNLLLTHKVDVDADNHSMGTPLHLGTNNTCTDAEGTVELHPSVEKIDTNTQDLHWSDAS